MVVAEKTACSPVLSAATVIQFLSNCDVEGAMNLSVKNRKPLFGSVAFLTVRGRDNHQRAQSKAATGVDQSCERGCERLERDQGGRQPADSLADVNDCRDIHSLSAMAWLRRELAKRASVGSALPFAQAFTTGN